jgi:hypothetical protein
MAWNEVNIAQLRELYELGIPTRRIAAELGMTKNMIIGKAGRLGLEHPNSTSPVEVYRPPYREIETPDFLHCQYPIGDVGQPGFRFCGDVAKIRSSYCEAHHAKCYRATQDREDDIVHVSKSPFNRLFQQPKESQMAIRHLNSIELAARWNISHRTLERWRWTGEGLPFIKIGGRVVYRLEDIEAFEANQLRTSTADLGSSLGSSLE